MQLLDQTQVRKRIQLLPESLQETYFSDRTTDAILKSCTLRDIPSEHVYSIGVLARRVLLGYLRPEEFAFEIQKETGVDAMKAAQVAHDMDTEIFSMVRLELKKLYPPILKTPTVQAQGFAPTQPATTQISEPKKPEPRFVVPIPEKYLNKDVWKRPHDEKLALPETTPPEPMLPPAPKVAELPKPSEPPKQEEVKAVQKPPEPPAPKPTPSAPPSTSSGQAVPQKKPEPKKDYIPPPHIKPVVPLPTFIQSKFKSEELKDFSKEPKEKEMSKESFVNKLGAPITEKKKEL